MQFFSTFALVFAGLASFVSADEAASDVVACAFNNYRTQNGMTPINIAETLVGTADKQAKYMNATQKMTTTGPKGEDVAQRLKDAGYKWTFAFVLVGQNYRNTQAFSQAMINEYKNVILNRQIAHVGASRVGNFWDVDFGASNSPVRVREPKCL